MRHVYEDLIDIAGAACASLTVNVTYTFHRGYPGSRIDPPEPDYCEVEGVTVECDGERLPQAVEAWFASRIMADEETLQAALLRDYAGGCEAASEAKAEAIREARRMEAAE